ncbi:basement membrane-specific heparan sulfate proteoglycan core protein [Biomphalaria glabrata]|nr:C-type lectin domain family 6 member A-like [Biomphalaria glabrata]
MNLIIICLLYVFVISECQICEHMTYHEHSQTCIVLVQHLAKHAEAEGYCRDLFYGGHLVHILDENTDTFIRGFLNSTTDKALIGLQDSKKNGHYTWGDTIKATSYFGWAFRPHIPSPSYSTAVATKHGWMEFGNSPANFLCQTQPLISKPVLKCPLLKEGESNASLVCEAWSNAKSTILSAKMYGATGQWANCTQDNCESELGLQCSLVVTPGKVSLTTKIDDVRRSDAGRVTCTFHLRNDLTSSASCDLNVYAVPQGPSCQHSFNETHITVRCTDSNVHPKVGCTWTHFIHQVSSRAGNVSSSEGTEINEQSVSQASTLSQRSCEYSVLVSSHGFYTFTVSMYPVIDDLDLKNESVTTTVDILIEPPVEEPKFYVTNGVSHDGALYASENTTSVISCSVHGGTPLVQDTRIQCDKEIKDISTQCSTSESRGHIASMRISIGRQTDNRSCVCSARHISQKYNLSKTITLFLTSKGEEFSEMLIVQLISGACFTIVALGVLVAVVTIKSHIQARRKDLNVKNEEERPGNEYVGLWKLNSITVPEIVIEEVANVENSVYHTIPESLSSKPPRQDQYIEFVPESLSIKPPRQDQYIEFVPQTLVTPSGDCMDTLSVPGSSEEPEILKADYLNWQPPNLCVTETPENDGKEDVNKDGYVIVRVLRRAKENIRRSLMYQNVRLKRSSKCQVIVDAK